VIGEPLSDGSAHHPRRDDGDDRIHAWSPMDARMSDLTTSLHPGKVRRQGGRASAVAADDQACAMVPPRLGNRNYLGFAPLPVAA
jgi:hypothetical protein